MIKYAWPGDIWFHVDKLSSAHVYARLGDGLGSGESESESRGSKSKSKPKSNADDAESSSSSSPSMPNGGETGLRWDTMPEALLADCAQLVKANSIEGPSCPVHIAILAMGFIDFI